jgi:asparagine synthase (glutamine-hydrolysing)
MSGLVAVLGVPAGSDEPHVRTMLDRARERGPEHTGRWSGEHGAIAVCRSGWELGPDFAAGVLLLEHDQLVVAADASLYYRDDLRRAIRSAGVRIAGDSPSHLIAAAYRAWGPALVEQLEGDFAFVLWDQRQNRLLAARDFAGTRPLYFAAVGNRLILGSALPVVAAHPAVPRALNRLALAEDLIGASSMTVQETAFLAIQRLPAGARLLWQPDRAPRVEQVWQPPQFDRGEGPDSADAADQLRALLRAATRERLAGDGASAVWMSGGFDSPAIFAVGQAAAKQSGHGPVVPVSMSYPPGDPGREDELIDAVGRHTGAAIRWMDVGAVPGWSDPMAWACQRDEPFAHPYHEWNRALALGARAAGARVALGGNGGDQFFSVSPVFLSDLLRAGRWRDLAREAGAIGMGPRTYREVFHWAIQPALPSWLLGFARHLRGGRPLRPHLLTPVPDWLGFDRPTSQAMWERQWSYDQRRPNESLGSAEAAWYLQAAFGQRMCAMLTGIALSAGVEPRSPMYDRRVLEFMARRPREDRFSGGETKRLLRQAMGGLLPAEHLARRNSRTGLPGSYLRRAACEGLPRWAEAAGADLRLADLGLVRPKAVRAALDRYLGNPRWESGLGVDLFNLYSAEFWIRAHAQTAPSAAVLVA